METARGQDKGFTLVELLIVIVILGILAMVTVFEVTGITDKGKTSACAAEYRTLAGAEEAYYAAHKPTGTYTDEQGLVDAGFLHETSSLHDISGVSASGYSVDGVGDCA